jgi:hypothetical protein
MIRASIISSFYNSNDWDKYHVVDISSSHCTKNLSKQEHIKPLTCREIFHSPSPPLMN